MDECHSSEPFAGGSAMGGSVRGHVWNCVGKIAEVLSGSAAASAFTPVALPPKFTDQIGGEIFIGARVN